MPPLLRKHGVNSIMTKESERPLLEKLEAGYGLPVLSPVAVKLVELASDECSSAQDLVKVIEKDPPLALRLVRLANSAFFNPRVPITSLTQAVMRIGFDRLRIMALSISLRETFPLGRVGPLDYEKFWKVSLYRAIISKSLAPYCKSVDPEEAFVAGLIMEIGLLILFDIFIKGKMEDVSLNLEPLEDLLAWEREQFGVDHREVGICALTYWKFPKSIIQCQCPQAPEQLETISNDLCKILELARICSQVLFQEGSGFNTIFRQGKKILGLDHSVMNMIILSAFDQVDQLASELNLEMHRERDLLGLMEKANKALSQISERIAQGYEKDGPRSLPTLQGIAQDHTVANTLQAVAHEIRNPLTAVGGFARKLASMLDPHSEEGKYINVILDEALRLEKLLSQMTQDQYPPCPPS